MARVFITGSTDGLGRAGATALLDAGHAVILHARTRQRAGDLGQLAERADAVVFGDLADGDQVRAVADQVNGLGRMDAVIHNAGVYRAPHRGSTPQGDAVTVAVNLLAPYVLTALIGRPERLIYLSSGLHRGGEGPLDDLDWNRRPWDAAHAYAESKLCVAALACAVARICPGVRSNAVDPGWVRTRMGGESAPVDLETGQRTQTWLAVSDDAGAAVTGGYWHNLQQETPAAVVHDPAFQDRLLARPHDLTGAAL